MIDLPGCKMEDNIVVLMYLGIWKFSMIQFETTHTHTQWCLGSPRIILWDKDSSLLYGKKLLGDTGRGMGEARKGRKFMKGVLFSKLSLLVSAVHPPTYPICISVPGAILLESPQSSKGWQLEIKPACTEIKCQDRVGQ